jgi:phage tail-like protein
MIERASAYTFGTAAQWQRCLVTGFDVNGGVLKPVARLGTVAQQSTSDGPVSIVAANLPGDLVWRLQSGGRRDLVRRTGNDDAPTTLAIDALLAGATRWVLERHSVWSFDAASRSVRRYERDSLTEDVALDLSAWTSVQDIAGDAADGLWILLADDDGRLWLLHVDCAARQQALYQGPPDLQGPAQLGALARGARLVVLGADGALRLLNGANGDEIRTITGWRSGSCWRADRLTTDRQGRIAVLGHDTAAPARGAVFILDSEGDLLDTISGTAAHLSPPPFDVAIAGDVLWLAADDGLWFIDSSDSSVARESENVLLTPALFSPDRTEAGGWLRAEISMTLPRGAVLEAEAVTTGDDRVANQVADIAADMSRSADQRRRDIWDLFDHRNARVYHITEAAGDGEPIAVPLFDKTDRWLWLQLRIVTPPDAAAPEVSGLRVLYPDASLMQRLPGVFRGSKNDPTGFLRSIVGVLETTSQRIDDKIRGLGAQIDPSSAPEVWLDEIAGWLDLPWEDALPPDAKRRLAIDAGPLLEMRGTRRGLTLLLRALIGPAGRVVVDDPTVDHPPLRLAGDGCDGARLPMLLAGARADAPVLGGHAVIGRVCLGASCDPLQCITPAVVIQIEASPSARRALGSLLQRIVANYVPAGLKVVVRWGTVSGAVAATGPEDIEVLDGEGPGRLGADSEVGRVVLGGGRGPTLDRYGLDVGFPLS